MEKEFLSVKQKGAAEQWAVALPEARWQPEVP
jgi:hypothetical protein